MSFPVEERFIEETEKKIGGRFPESFRKRMMINNGGEVSTPEDTWDLNPFFDSSNKKRLCRTCNDIRRETEIAKKWSGFPDNGISIAQNGCGDHLVFLITDSGEIDPKVYLWFHETCKVKVVSPDFSLLAD